MCLIQVADYFKIDEMNVQMLKKTHSIAPGSSLNLVIVASSHHQT